MALSYVDNLEDYGFYQVGHTRFFNKIHAILESQRTGQQVRWNFCDQEYDQHDWSREPETSLSELYAQRARDLREKYDYLVLHFSGGSDSCNILETFINNNIHLDEVLIRGSYQQADRVRSGIVGAHNNYSECLVQSLPLAQWVRDNHMPHLRITVTETTDLILDYYKNNTNWFEYASTQLTPMNFLKANPERLAPHYQTLADQGQSVAHIYGAEKPAILRHRDQFYTRWLDTQVANFVTLRSGQDTAPQFTELFYWGRNAIPLQIKQLHVLKNHIKKNRVPDMVFDGKRALAMGDNERNAGQRINRWTANLVYTRSLPLIMEHLKPLSQVVIRDMDLWFAKDVNLDAFENYRRGVDYLGTLLPKDNLDPGGIWSNNGIRIIRSKPRYLGT